MRARGGVGVARGGAGIAQGRRRGAGGAQGRRERGPGEVQGRRGSPGARGGVGGAYEEGSQGVRARVGAAHKPRRAGSYSGTDPAPRLAPEGGPVRLAGGEGSGRRAPASRRMSGPPRCRDRGPPTLEGRPRPVRSPVPGPRTRTLRARPSPRCQERDVERGGTITLAGRALRGLGTPSGDPLPLGAEGGSLDTWCRTRWRARGFDKHYKFAINRILLKYFNRSRAQS